MPVVDDYALIMLDLNSPNVEIKLSTLNKIGELESKNRYIGILKKLTKHKNKQVKDKAMSILKSAGISTDSHTLNPACLEIDLKDVLKLFKENAFPEDVRFFEPYFQFKPEQGDKSPHIPLDVRERIQKFITSSKPIDKVIGLCLIILIPLEFKNKVTALVDLLRDTNPIVVAISIQHLPCFKKEIIKKVLPIILEKFKDDNVQIFENLEEFLYSIDANLFTEDLKLIKKEGLSMKTGKSLYNKLCQCLQ